jgi:hypothetical protein
MQQGLEYDTNLRLAAPISSSRVIQLHLTTQTLQRRFDIAQIHRSSSALYILPFSRAHLGAGRRAGELYSI